MFTKSLDRKENGLQTSGPGGSSIALRLKSQGLYLRPVPLVAENGMLRPPRAAAKASEGADAVML